jgi:hypothetical protein
MILTLSRLDDGQDIPKPKAHIWRSDSVSWSDPEDLLDQLPQKAAVPSLKENSQYDQTISGQMIHPQPVPVEIPICSTSP